MINTIFSDCVDGWHKLVCGKCHCVFRDMDKDKELCLNCEKEQVKESN